VVAEPRFDAVARPGSAFRPEPAAVAKAADADRVVSGAGAQLDYLSSVSVGLGLPDPVQEYFGPVVGRWRDLHAQAEAWRRAAHSIEELAGDLTAPLGQLDEVWQGAVSDSFLAHVRQIGKAATSSADAMAAMAGVLDRTGEAMHELVTDLVDVLSGGADRVSLALLLPSGEARAANHIAELHAHGRRILESVHQLLEAFATLCHNLDERQPFADVKQATPFPERSWSFAATLTDTTVPAPSTPAGTTAATAPEASPAPVAGSPHGVGSAAAHGIGSAGAHGIGSAGAHTPAHAPAPPEPGMRTYAAQPGTFGTSSATPATAATTSAAAAGTRAAAAGAAGGVPFMPMGAGMGGQGGESERKPKSNITADPADIFGKPTKTPPPVIGED
jgi:uncharacterized protein YukE